MAFSKRVTLQQAASMGGRKWEAVSTPDAAFAYVPFTVQQNGSQFRADPAFNLRTHANITVTKTYWLDTVNGNDGWPGTEAQPLKTWNAVIGKGDYDRIVIKDGSYLIRSESSLAPARNTEIIGEGTVHFTSDRTGDLGAWSLTVDQTYTYQATVAGGNFVSRICDYGHLDTFGNPALYASKASIAEVEAAAGSFYWLAGGTLYVHTLDENDPTGNSDLVFLDSLVVSITADNLTVYYENIRFLGGIRLRNNSATGGLKSYFKNCIINDISVLGVDEIIFQGCDNLISSGDIANYDTRNGITTKAIEIDCEFYDGGLAADNQASTIHSDTLMVRINGKYHHSSGQNIADIVTGKTWMLGCEMYNSTTGVGAYFSNTAWLDRCNIHDNATDLHVAATGTVHTREITSGGNNQVDAGGTLDTY